MQQCRKEILNYEQKNSLMPIPCDPRLNNVYYYKVLLFNFITSLEENNGNTCNISCNPVTYLSKKKLDWAGLKRERDSSVKRLFQL